MTQYEPLQTTPPRYLTGFADTAWKQIVPLLNERKVGNISKTLVEQYCSHYALYRDAQKAVSEYGVINPDSGKKNPAVAVMTDATKSMRGLASDLGLSPQSQVQLQKLMNESNDDDNQVDIASFLSQGAGF